MPSCKLQERGEAIALRADSVQLADVGVQRRVSSARHLRGEAELAQLLLHGLLRERGAKLHQRRLPRLRQRDTALRRARRRCRRGVHQCCVLSLSSNDRLN